MARSRKAKTSRQALSSVKSTEAAMRRLAFEACSKQWWFTAVFDIAAGLWMVLAGIIMFFSANDSGFNVFGWVLLGLSLAVFVVVPRFLDEQIVIPSGICLCCPERTPGTRGLSLASLGGFLGIALYGTFVLGNYLAAFGAIWAVLPLFAYVYAGRVRHYLLALWAILSFTLCESVARAIGMTVPAVFGLIIFVTGVMCLVAGARCLHKTLRSMIRDSVEEADGVARLQDGWFTPEEITAGLTSPDSTTRYLAAAFLRDYVEPRVLAPLIETAHDLNNAVATMARRALSSIWGPSPDEILRWNMKHFVSGSKVPTTKQHVVTLEELKEFEHQRYRVEKDVASHEREVEQVLAHTVGTDEHVLNGLIALATDEDDGASDVRIVASEMLGATRTHRAYAVLVNIMLDGNRSMVNAASEGFRGAASGAVVHLEPLFGDSREWVRIAAVDAGINLLDSLGETDAKDAGLAKDMLRRSVFALAQHPNPVTRAMSMELLAHYGEEAVDSITTACEDTYALVRGEGIRALSLVSPDRARDYVIRALGDSRAFVRSTAISCVAYLRLSEARTTLSELTKDSDKTVALLAERLLFVSQEW